MTAVTRGVGVVLVMVGVGAWLLAGGFDASPTALLPAVLGLVILVLGLLAGRESLHHHMIHGALVVALLGVLATLGRAIPQLVGGDVDLATWASLLTALVCIVYVALGVRSFVVARKARNASG